jgi:hypothetical protein
MPRFGPKITAFLRAIEVMPNVTRAAKAARINKSQHYAKLNSSLEYRAAFDACMAIGCDAMSDVAIERAQIGWDEPVVYKGQLSYPEIWSDELGYMVPDRTQQPFSVRKIDNNLLQFVLRNRHPDYREQREERNPEAATAPPLVIQTYTDDPPEKIEA